MLKNIVFIFALVLVGSALRIAHTIDSTNLTNITKIPNQTLSKIQTLTELGQKLLQANVTLQTQKKQIQKVTQELQEKAKQSLQKLVNETEKGLKVIQDKKNSVTDEGKTAVEQPKPVISPYPVTQVTTTTQSTSPTPETVTVTAPPTTTSPAVSTGETTPTPNTTEPTTTPTSPASGQTGATGEAGTTGTGATVTTETTVVNSTQQKKPQNATVTQSEEQKKEKEQGNKFIESQVSKLNGVPIKQFAKQNGDELKYTYDVNGSKFIVNVEELKQQNKPTKFKLIKIEETKPVVDGRGEQKNVSGIGSFEQAVKILHWD